MKTDILKPLMSNEELLLFESVISNSNYYLEFGCGGSTFTSLMKSNAKIFSVESDLEWIYKLKDYKLIIDNIFENRLSLIHADIGRVGEWDIQLKM